MEAFRETRRPKVLKSDVPVEKQWINTQTGENWEKYCEKLKEVHGPDADPLTTPYDPTVALLAGEGRKNGRFAFADGAFDTSGTPSLSQICASQTSSAPSIVRRPRPGLAAMAALQVQKFFVSLISTDRKSTRLNSSHITRSRMPSSA